VVALDDPGQQPDTALDMRGKVALVTGGTRGLGRSIAHGLAAHGADLVIASRHQDACDEAAADILASTSVQVLAHACHVGKWAHIDTLVSAANERFGRIDVLVNNAGMSPTYPSLPEVSEALFDKTLDVNLKGPFRLAAVVGSQMAARGQGAIVNISSTGVIHPSPDYLPYAAAKAGLNTITLGFARAFGPGVRVNGIMAGPFQTDVASHWDQSDFAQRFAKLALQRIGQPDEIVGAVLYFVSAMSTYTTGAILTVNGGEP
jgi:NAD(P)-dependent dehydrogenase (short-subunit alcohol dehydrogenase family)